VRGDAGGGGGWDISLTGVFLHHNPRGVCDNIREMADQLFVTGRGQRSKGVASDLKKNISNTTPYGNLREVIWPYILLFIDSFYVHMKISGTCILFIPDVLK
jgi:hypothetical protein